VLADGSPESTSPTTSRDGVRLRLRWARLAECAFFALFATALILKVATAAGVAMAFLDTTLGLALTMAAIALALGRKGLLWLDGWRLLLVLPALWSLPAVYERVGGDGIEYFALARTLAFDQDLDFANEFEGLGVQPVRTATGEATSRFPVGLALLWLPALLATRLVALVASWSGAAVDLSGFAFLYQTAATTTTFALTLFGIVLLERFLRASFGAALATLSVLGIWLATPLHFYAVANPSMSHGASAFAATVFLLSWMKARNETGIRPWLVVGLAGGLMSLIRVQDGVLLAMPALDLVARRGGLRALAALAAGPVFAAMLQVAIWWGLYGHDFFAIASKQGHYSRPDPNVLGVLFSARHGLLTWTPLYALALLGWVLWLGRDTWFAALFWLAFALSVSFNSLMTDWWGADAFGQRRLLGLTPLLAMGLAEALAFLRRRPLIPIGTALLGFILWNQQFATIYNSGLLAGKGEAISLDRLASAQVELSARRLVEWSPRIPRGIFVVLYDNLRGVWLDERPQSLGGLVDFGDEPEEFPVVGHGWSPPLLDAGTTCRFSNVPRSWIQVPIKTPGDFDVTLRIRAAFDAAPVSLRVEAGGEPLGEEPLTLQWSEVKFNLPAGRVAPGINQLALSYSSTPAAVIPGFKGRNAAVAVDWIRFTRRTPSTAH